MHTLGALHLTRPTLRTSKNVRFLCTRSRTCPLICTEDSRTNRTRHSTASNRHDRATRRADYRAPYRAYDGVGHRTNNRHVIITVGPSGASTDYALPDSCIGLLSNNLTRRVSRRPATGPARRPTRGAMLLDVNGPTHFSNARLRIPTHDTAVLPYWSYPRHIQF